MGPRTATAAPHLICPRKLDLVELNRERLGRGDVEFVSRSDDPREYK